MESGTAKRTVLCSIVTPGEQKRGAAQSQAAVGNACRAHAAAVAECSEAQDLVCDD